jgi:hypothetical protein
LLVFTPGGAYMFASPAVTVARSEMKAGGPPF